MEYRENQKEKQQNKQGRRRWRRKKTKKKKQKRESYRRWARKRYNMVVAMRAVGHGEVFLSLLCDFSKIPPIIVLISQSATTAPSSI
jgi:hypothetical protein